MFVIYVLSHHFGGLLISNLSKMLKFAATHRKMTTKSKHQLISKLESVCEKYNESKDMRNPRTTSNLNCLF